MDLARDLLRFWIFLLEGCIAAMDTRIVWGRKGPRAKDTFQFTKEGILWDHLGLGLRLSGRDAVARVSF